MSLPGNISYEDFALPLGLVTVAGARNGLSMDGDNFIVLGQSLAEAGAPAKLLSDREIPFQDFSLSLGIPGESTVSKLVLALGSMDYEDPAGIVRIRLRPPGNTTDVGLPGQDLIAVSVTEAYNYNNPASSGNIIDFQSSSDFGATAGTVNFFPFVAVNSISLPNPGPQYASFLSDPQIFSAAAGNVVRGFYHPVQANVNIAQHDHRAFENTTGDVYLCTFQSGTQGGRVGIRQDIDDPEAFLHIGSGLPDVGNAILKFTPGALLGVAERGAWEYEVGTLALYYTRDTVRENVLTSAGGAAAPATTLAVVQTGYFGTGGVNYLSAPTQWLSVLVAGVNLKIPAYA